MGNSFSSVYMAQYKQSDISNIFWASNEGFKTGRDPLGIQNSSIATYSKLLPGLTNLTRHIRYYSIYCWLLSEYDKLDKNRETDLHQYDFIRRAELALALIMKDRGVSAVVGSLFISKGRCKMLENGVYDIADGANYTSKDRYWAFRSGAFGQYYLGSLIYYELVKIEEDRFYLRNKGKDLADAFRNSVDQNIRELFLDCLLDGNITEEEILKLEPVCLDCIVSKSKEWEYLNNLLIKKDESSSYRRDTIYLLLHDISNGIEIKEFARNRFLNVDANFPASFGWYFYYLCETLHYCIDSFFSLILLTIQDLGNPTTTLLSQHITESLMAEIDEKKEDITLDELRKKTEGNIDTLYDDVKEKAAKQDYISAVAQAIKLLLRLYTEFEQNAKAIENFERDNNLKHQRGIFSAGIKSYIKRYLNLPLSKFIKTLIIQIMEEHTFIAISKMGTNNSDLRKFIFEDGHLVLVERRYPVETSPRIYALYGFLQDMGYITNDYQLTKIAKQFIENYGKE